MAYSEGRPTKLTEKCVARILEAVRLGAPMTTASARGGVRYNTVREWDKAGKSVFERIEEENEKDGTQPLQVTLKENALKDFHVALGRAKANEIGSIIPHSPSGPMPTSCT